MEENTAVEVPVRTPDPKIQAKNANRPSRAAEPIGKVHPREITKIRDQVGEIRDMSIADNASGAGSTRITAELNELYSVIDRLDLRFKIHHDPASSKPAKKAPK